MEVPCCFSLKPPTKGHFNNDTPTPSIWASIQDFVALHHQPLRWSPGMFSQASLGFFLGAPLAGRRGPLSAPSCWVGNPPATWPSGPRPPPKANPPPSTRRCGPRIRSWLGSFFRSVVRLVGEVSWDDMHLGAFNKWNPGGGSPGM